MQRSLIFNDVTLKWIEHIKVKLYNIWSFPKKKKKRCSSFKGDNSMSVIIYLVWQENKKKLT